MKKIIIIASSSGMINQLSERAKALFPECEISVVCARPEDHEEISSKTRFLKQGIGDDKRMHYGIYPVLTET